MIIQSMQYKRKLTNLKSLVNHQPEFKSGMS